MRKLLGVDPGDVFGLAVLADCLAIYRENCFSVKEVSEKILRVLKNVGVSPSSVTVRVGSGVPVHKELLEELDRVLPVEVILEVVGESGTNRNIKFGRRRGLGYCFGNSYSWAEWAGDCSQKKKQTVTVCWLVCAYEECGDFFG
jgi:hypothetical protein